MIYTFGDLPTCVIMILDDNEPPATPVVSPYPVDLCNPPADAKSQSEEEKVKKQLVGLAHVTIGCRAKIGTVAALGRRTLGRHGRRNVMGPVGTRSSSARRL